MSKFGELLKEKGRATGKSGPGRPQARRSDPDYTQVTAYIPKTLHKQAKIRLLQEDKQFSELVEELLAEWLNR